jgi:Septum formation
MSDFPQPPPYPSPYQPPPGVQQAPRNGLGIAALTLGIIGVVAGIFPFLFWVAGILGIIGLILGFLGRGRAKRGEATNGTMALWGIITSAVAVVISVIGAVILVGVFADLSEDPSAETENTVSPVAENTVTPTVETSAPAEETAPTAPTAPVEVDAYKLEVGDCFAEVPEGELVTVPVVPCAEPHIYEVYAQLMIPEGDYPGDDAVFEQTDELCIAEFEPFVGLSYEESVLDVFYLSPTEESWLDGDRAVTCSIYDPGEDVSGSLRGVER